MVYFDQTSQRKNNLAGHHFSLHCLTWHFEFYHNSNLFLFKASQGTNNKKLQFHDLNIRVPTINHGPSPYGGHTKEQSTYRCTLKNITIRRYLLKDIRA